MDRNYFPGNWSTDECKHLWNNGVYLLEHQQKELEILRINRHGQHQYEEHETSRSYPN
jgi:hypothetical protein